MHFEVQPLLLPRGESLTQLDKIRGIAERPDSLFSVLL